MCELIALHVAHCEVRTLAPCCTTALSSTKRTCDVLPHLLPSCNYCNTTVLRCSICYTAIVAVHTLRCAVQHSGRGGLAPLRVLLLY